MNGRESGENKAWWRIPPLGLLALASMVICTLTGIMLAPAYKPDAPLDSLALLLLKNPAGVFVRSVHYWSAQAFLILVLGHIMDHLLRRSEAEVSFGVWLRLSLTVPVIVGVMLSGFLLRADAAAVQALRVLRTLLGFVPVIGTTITPLLIGSGSDLFTVYVHHICTGTLVIWLVTMEHSRRIMPGTRSVWWTLPPVLLFSLFWVPGLEWRAGGVEKGPWYLVGWQELLHWLPQPQASVWLALTGLGLLMGLPKFPAIPRSRLKRMMVLATFGYAVLTMVGLGFRGEGWQLKMPGAAPAHGAAFLSRKAYLPPDTTLVKAVVPMVNGQREGCLACHQGMTGFSPAHDLRALGCAACHLGNPFTLDKAVAHAGMTLTPGNLSVVNQTCAAANCHGDVATRVRGSLMNTMSGVVAVDKFVFGESRDPDGRFDVAALKHSPADTHLRNLCASCHLGQDKPLPGPTDESSRGGGCSACHVRYGSAAAGEVGRTAGSPAPLHHPEISVTVAAVSCFGCHSRSGRIATNYEGWHETLLDEETVKSKPGWPGSFRQLPDGRIFEKHPADVHFERGMTCIDCHVAAEVMGDGAAHAHEKDAVKISCADCHEAGSATAAAELTELDVETQKIIALRQLNEAGRKFVVAPSRSIAYPNVFLDAGGHPLLALKESARFLHPKPSAAVCARTGSVHERLDCGSCHTAWAPQCISCHTSFDSAAQGWDHLAGKPVSGAWEEKAGDFRGDAPTLGVERATLPNGKTGDRITTFVPGMILHLQVPNGDAKGRDQFHRLFAPASPHTTAAQARDCRACHANPSALGYGRGRMVYEVAGGAGEWRFTPEFPSSREDGLPLDAWIGFLREPSDGTVTRKNARPFNLREQQQILLVGACLHCHDEKEPRLRTVFADFNHYRAALGPQCLLPGWSGR